MAEFTERQPKDGDVILHCGHLKQEGSVPWHFFSTAPGGKFEFVRPDGTPGEAKWLVCCDECFDKRGARFDVVGDDVWKGDDPIIVIDPEVN